ncbi:hypothetical protein ACHAXT_012645 [Thalassiosira profunda]
MTDAAPNRGAAAEDAPSSAADAPSPDTSPIIAPGSAHPYQPMLQQLQSQAIRAQDSHEEKSEQRAWDLSSDALLASLLREFSSHVVARTHQAAKEVRALQNAVNATGVEVARCQAEFMRRSEEICMEQVVGDDESDDEEGDADGNGERREEHANQTEDLSGDGDDSSADIARLEEEERSAIADGMQALHLFYDPRRPPKSNGGEGKANDAGSGKEDGRNGSSVGSNRQLENAEEDVIGEHCYHYPAADADGFNQRPLPFYVGSREFMEDLLGDDAEDDVVLATNSSTPHVFARKYRVNSEYAESKSWYSCRPSSSSIVSTARIAFNFCSHFCTRWFGPKSFGVSGNCTSAFIRSLSSGCNSSTARWSNFTASMAVIKCCTVSATVTATLCESGRSCLSISGRPSISNRCAARGQSIWYTFMKSSVVMFFPSAARSTILNWLRSLLHSALYSA